MKSIESFLERSMLKHIALEFTYNNKYGNDFIKLYDRLDKQVE